MFSSIYRLSKTNSTLCTKYVNVSFLVSASYGADRSEAVIVARARMIQYASVVVYVYYFFVRRSQNEFSRPI